MRKQTAIKENSENEKNLIKQQKLKNNKSGRNKKVDKNKENKENKNVFFMTHYPRTFDILSKQAMPRNIYETKGLGKWTYFLFLSAKITKRAWNGRRYGCGWHTF